MLNRKNMGMFLMIIGIMGTIFALIFHNVADKQDVRAVNGVLDLSNWSFVEKGAVKLDGEWEFYPGQLLTPKDFVIASQMPQEQAPPSKLVNVPGKWNDYLSGEGSRAGIGYGTYRLKIQLPSHLREIYGVYTSNIRMANRIYLNNQMIGASGAPAANEYDGVQNNVPYIGLGTVAGDSVELIVQVANYSYATGGIIYSITFGEQHTIIKNREMDILLGVLTIAGFLIPGLFCLLLYALRKQEKGLMFLGLFCLSSMIFMMTQGERLISQLLPDLPYSFVLKLQPISSVFVYYFLLCIVNEMLPGIVHPKVMRFLKWLASITILLELIATPLFISKLEVLIMAQGLLMIVYYIYVIIRGVGRKAYTDPYWFLSLQSIVMMMLASMMRAYGFLESTMLISFEMLLFVFAHAGLFAKRFTKSIREVEQLSEKLLTLDGLKDEFMTMTSHELRTPLHGIINMAASMLEGAAGPLNNTKQAEHLSMIVSTGKQLSALIQDILEFAELRGGVMKLAKRKIYFQPVLHAVVEVVEHLLIDKQVQIQQRLPANLPLLDADEDRLRQILYNLLGNAAKATIQGKITISAVTQANKVRVDISDTGMGMSPEQLETIFLSERKAKAALAGFQGSGFGLRITKQLVELGGGTISVHSIAGKGTTFSFTIPIAQGQQTDEADIPYQEQAAAIELTAMLNIPPPAAEFRVLVVDDDPINLQVLINLLSIERCEVTAVRSGDEALEEALAAPAKYDLVITDWMMPKMSGIELCRKIRERFLLSELPVLLLTARTKPEDIKLGFEAGVNDYVGKPVDAGELRARVQTLLALRKSVKLAVQAEMAFLQAQIKPHFLYNALNTIIAICPVDPYKAMELLIELSQFLRSSFDFHNRDKMTTIERELELVKSYLTLEKARFDERLKIEYEISCDELALIPPLTIQPIVENAVNHGVMKKEEGGTIKLKISEVDNCIMVLVEDDGVGFSTERLSQVLSDKGTGRVGLSNIHQRLINLYGSGLVIDGQRQHGAEVSFRYPKELRAGTYNEL
ncbi:ATP-binding protein [Paenibacillus sp. FSL H8-0537]|uniref:hybrid sensor histidine kinase/response regulator n=1 Tax=Paenibacillus sp. FSL H8-0537 TaxID=2921399 RepID=UPI003100D33C